VARSLERVWEESSGKRSRSTLIRELGAQQRYRLPRRTRSDYPLGEDLPKLWMRERGRAQADPSARCERGRLDHGPGAAKSGSEYLRPVVSEHKVRRNVRATAITDIGLLKHGSRSVVRENGSRNRKSPQCGRPTVSSRSAFSGGEVICYAKLEYPKVKINRTEHNPDNGRMGHTPFK